MHAGNIDVNEGRGRGALVGDNLGGLGGSSLSSCQLRLVLDECQMRQKLTSSGDCLGPLAAALA